MLSFFKKLFSSKPAETVVEVPYKVETAVAPVVEATTTVETKPAKAPVKSKKPAVKKATTRKPRATKAPK